MDKWLKYLLQVAGWISFSIPLLYLGIGLYAYLHGLRFSIGDEGLLISSNGPFEFHHKIFLYWVSITLCSLVISLLVGFAASLYVSEYASRSILNSLKSWVRFQFVVPPLLWWLLGCYAYIVLSGILPVSMYRVFDTEFNQVSEFKGMIWAFSTIPPASWGILWALALIPFTTSMFFNTLSKVSKTEKLSAYALGATQLQVIRMVILPEVKSRLIIAAFLVLVRSVAEMSIVFMFLVEEYRQPLYLIGSASLFLLTFFIDQFSKRNPT